MTDSQQPRPSAGSDSEPVTDALKARFAGYIDERTAVGMAKYGQPLHTHDGRDTAVDMADELLDFCQYQQKWIQELEWERAALTAEIQRLQQELEAKVEL